jgi:outer membrane murein-binding lipoprotein Lpp
MQYLAGFYAAFDNTSYTSISPDALKHLQMLMENLTAVGCKIVDITDERVDIVVHKDKPKARGKGKEDGKLHVLEGWVIAMPTDGSKIEFPDKEFLARDADDSVCEDFAEKTKAAYYIALESQVAELKAKVARLEEENQRLRESSPSTKRAARDDGSSEAKRPKTLRADMPEDVKQAFVECYGQALSSVQTPLCIELGDTDESVKKLQGSARLYRFYRTNPVIAGFFKGDWPASETFRKNYNGAVADLYKATQSNPNTDVSRMESVNLFDSD